MCQWLYMYSGKGAQLAQHFIVQIAPVGFLILLNSVGFDGSLIDLFLSIHCAYSVPHCGMLHLRANTA